MNKRAFRLVFDRRRNMRVPAAENARAAGKPAGGASPAAGVLACALGMAALLPATPAQAQTARPPVVFASRLPAPVQPLPVPYGGNTGRTDRSFVVDPAKAAGVKWNVDGKRAVFDQGAVERVILNWDSFDIGAGFAVHFKQDKDPAKYVSALNRIWSADPSVILGSLTADREVILLNANGVYFGRGAVVDTGKFVATSLNIADAVFERGLRNVTDGSAVFDTAGQGYLPTRLDGAISVEAGAEIRSAAGGDVLLVAPRVVNQGRIETPAGQTVMAAGDKVYLMSSSDPAQRGLIVAVDPIKVLTTRVDAVSGTVFTEEVIDRGLGIVENAATGSYKTQNGRVVDSATPDTTAGLVNKLNEIRADSGAINLVGLMVRQNGNAHATTAVKGANGAIYLQAQESTTTLDKAAASARGLSIENGGSVKVGNQLGSVVLGGASNTSVRPSADNSQTQFNAEVFNRSRIRVEGRAIHLETGATVAAPSGSIELLAASQAQSSTLFNTNASVQSASDDSRIVIDSGVTIDAAGLRKVELDGARNQGELRLFRIELADAPVQRTGPLYRGAVQFGLTDLDAVQAANVAGAASTIGRSARERSTSGGAVRIEGEGAVVVGNDARIDISGGSVRYGETNIKTSLLSRGGRVMAFSTADGSQRYDALLSATLNRRVLSYDEGKDGGSLSVVGRQGYFGGTLQASTVEGVYQRRGSDRAMPAAATFGRQVGAQQSLQTIGLGAGVGESPTPDFFSDALAAPLTDLASGFDLSLPMLQASGLGRLSLRAAEVTQLGGAGLDLGVAGVLDIAARTIALSGNFAAPGGRISLRTSNVFAGDDADLGNITLAPGSALSTAGVWTNDAPLASGAPTRVQLNGGSIDIAAARSVVAGQGSRIDVSAGAWQPAGRKLGLGAAGQLTLTAGSDLADATLLLGGDIAGFDFSAGGTLTLGVPQLSIGGTADTGFSLKPEFFSADGFGTIAVRSVGDVLVAGGTVLAPQLRNWVLGPGSTQSPSGAMRPGVAAAQFLDESIVDRKPVNLTLAATGQIGGTADIPGASIRVERGAGIVLEDGGKLILQAARDIVVGATGAVSAQRTTLQALGGEITLRTTGKRGAASQDNAGEDSIGFVPEQAIWLGESATLSVAGAAELRTQRASRFAVPTPTFTDGAASATLTVGNVRGGGTLTLDASRGYVIAEAGSQMLLDGKAADLNFAGLRSGVTVAKSAGTLNVSSPEGFVLDGSISALAPVDAQSRRLADGGRLKLELGPGGVSTITLASDRAYPGNADNPRQIIVSEADRILTTGAIPVEYGDDLAAALGNGKGMAPMRLLDRSGFDALTLRAGDQLLFSGSAGLDKALGIDIDAPAIGATPGSDVKLRATRVALGNPSFSRNGDALPADTSAAPDASGDGSTKVSIRAEIIDVLGHSGLKGFSTAALHADQVSTGELRFTGNPGTAPTQGSLSFAGTLDIVAGQSYVTSYSRFDLLGLEPGNGALAPSRLLIGATSAGRSLGAPLSAFGDLRITASDIVQGGVLRQPFGAIALNAAGTLTLGAGSETSVSGSGQVIPFGTTTNLSQWFSSAVSLEIGAPLLDKQVKLSAGRLITAATSLVSARGGGDLQAWEFFPGVGGSKDYFETAGLYAVLPDYKLGFAPRSEESSSASTSLTGAQIQITLAGSGLASGRYTLLPARYALLADSRAQGAFLVKLAPDQGSAVLGRAIQQDDGSTVVSGYVTQAGSSFVGQPGQRFVVEPSPVFRAKSEIRLSRMSDFFTARALSLGNSPNTVPRDAGAISFDVVDGSGTILDTAIDLQAVQGARAGTLDIAAPSIALVTRSGDAPTDGLGVTTSTLQSAQAGSILLGGIRAAAISSDNGLPAVSVDTSRTRNVLVATSSTQPVQLQELILAGSERVQVADGAALDAGVQGSLGPHEVRLSGDGAFAAVSANAGLKVLRSGAALSAGTLSTGARSRLAGPSVQLDATGQLTLDPSTELLARSFVLGARRVSVGGASGKLDATILEGRLLDSVLDADALELRSYSSIDFVGLQDIAKRSASSGDATKILQSLVLDAPTVRGVDRLALDGSVLQTAATDLAARQVTLRNTAVTVSSGTGVASPTVPEIGLVGTGNLRIDSLSQLQFGKSGGIAIGPGAQSLGYADASLNATGDIVLQGSGSLTGQGSVNLTSARLTAKGDAAQSIVANGTLEIATTAQARSLFERTGQGAQVRLSGSTIVQGGIVDLPSGLLTLEAAGTSADTAAISFLPSSVTRAAGFSIAAQDGWLVHGDGGQISARAALGRIDALGTIDVGVARDALGLPLTGSAGKLEFSAIGAGGQVKFERSLVAADGTVSTVVGSIIGHGGGASTNRGGQFTLDAQSQDVAPSGVSNFGRTASLIGAGGFDREVDLRVRTGDAQLNGEIRAERIGITVDRGSLEIGAGALNADAARGGVVKLQAQGNVALGNGVSVSARSSRIGANGGDVLLSSALGLVQIAPSAVIDATGDDAQDGRIVLRAQRGDDGQSVNVGTLNADNLRAAEVDVEAVRVYRSVTASGVTRDITAVAAGNSALAGSVSNRTGTLGQASVSDDSSSFMASAESVLSGLGVSAEQRDRVHLRAGVEVQASGNLTIASDWLLNGDRPGGDAGLLTLRANGNLLINGTVSDGFSAAAAAAELSGDTRSWSYRFASGADLSSADLLATRDQAAGSAATGNLTIASGRLVRTGAGSIEMAAGGDIVFAGTTSSGQAYVAGRRATDQDALHESFFANQSVKPIVTEQGGRLEMAARGGIRAPAPTQFIGNWFWRSGLLDPLNPQTYAGDSMLAWWSEIGRFQQTAASFGGGNISVRAGRDVTNLSLMAPTTAWADSFVVSQANTVVRNGGDIDVAAGGSITDGHYFVGRGEGRLRAAGAVQSSAPTSGRAISFAAIDGSWDVAARGNVRIGTIFNPTLSPAPTADDRANTTGYFGSYGNGSTLELTSLGGSVNLAGVSTSVFGTYRLSSVPNGVRLYQLLPESLRVNALNGDITFGTSQILAPSSNGQLALYAAGNINFAAGATVGMVDSPNGVLPDVRRPLQQAELRQITDGVASVVGVSKTAADGSRFLADGQVHSELRADDAEPARIAAGRSIVAAPSGALNLSKRAIITAGQDINNLTLLGQHHAVDDLTSVVAGRNILHTDRGGYSLAGPGQLQLVAGRQLALGASLGVTTTGNVSNSTLPLAGASVKLAAAAAGKLDVVALNAGYLTAPSQSGGSINWQRYRNLLVRYVEDALRTPAIDFTQAWTLFQSLPPSAQAAFGQQLLAAEFSAVYLSGSPPTSVQLTDDLRAGFDRSKASIVSAIDAVLAAGDAEPDGGQAILLAFPGRQLYLANSRPVSEARLVLALAEYGSNATVVSLNASKTGGSQIAGASDLDAVIDPRPSRDALITYRNSLIGIGFDGINVSSTVAGRVDSLRRIRSDWEQTVAARLGGTASSFAAIGQSNPQDPAFLAYQAALTTHSGAAFESFRSGAMQREIASSGSAASNFGVLSLPMRLALFDQGFLAAELAGTGSFVAQPIWPGSPPLISYNGSMDLTQSSVITRRGGDIALVNPGGAINVGLKDAGGNRNGASGVIALGGGDVFGFARDDFQVNTQRVFVVGTGNMTLWSSRGDIDSGRGQNTAVGTPPLAARRSADGLVFEVPATTTGSGLGILADAAGLRAGTIGLYPAFGEILALDAFIRAPSVVLGSTVKGADNLQAASVGGAAAAVSAPPPTVTSPAPSTDNKAAAAQTGAQNQESRPRSSLLTVELLGLGAAPADEICEEKDRKDGKCPLPATRCSDVDKTAGKCP